MEWLRADLWKSLWLVIDDVHLRFPMPSKRLLPIVELLVRRAASKFHAHPNISLLLLMASKVHSLLQLLPGS
jgi:hypothetical protein